MAPPNERNERVEKFCQDFVEKQILHNTITNQPYGAQNVKKIAHMGIFPHATSQVKLTLPSRAMVETMFAGPTTFCFFMFVGPTTLRANCSETTLIKFSKNLQI
tara:strand:+ start:475 stop:786 length:312 start_codon:yes stop_codon:yes gene_type:complete